MKGPYNLSLSIIFFSILSNLLLLPYPPRCLSCGLGALHRSFPSAAALPPMQPSLAVGAPLPWHRMLSLSLGPATPWPCRTRIAASPCPPLPYGRTHSCHELCRPRAPVDARAYAASPDDRAPVASCLRRELGNHARPCLRGKAGLSPPRFHMSKVKADESTIFCSFPPQSSLRAHF